MTLVSLNCSGESIEKVISLFYTSYQNNSCFYDKYDRIILFYCNNLPKANKKLSKIHGTTSFYNSIFDNSKIKLYDIIKYLCDEKFITEKQSSKLLANSNLAFKVFSYIPASLVYRKEYNNIISKFKKLFPKVDLIELSIKENIIKYIENGQSYDCHSRVYGLQIDGNVSNFYLGNMDKKKQKSMTGRINRSIVLSPNIYMFINMILNYCENNIDDYIIGYRPMNRFPRNSYNRVIHSIKSNLIVEPKNNNFGALLNRISLSLSVEERANIAIMKAFLQFNDVST